MVGRTTTLFEQLKTTIEQFNMNNNNVYPIKAIVQTGSVAKGTNLDDSDLDVFVGFDYEYEKTVAPKHKFDNFIHSLAEYIFGSANNIIKYASYMYIETEIEGIKVNIVPYHHAESVAQVDSAVVRSPFHVKFVNESLNATQKNDVKKLKEFLKLSGLYGADNQTKGFSGYLCEVLV